MVVSRRRLIAGGLSSSVAACLSPALSALGKGRELFAVPWLDGETYGVSVVDGDGGAVFEVELPQRGHGMAIDPSERTMVVFARRPGNFAMAIDLARQTAPVVFHTPANRHFYGHGSFSTDGALLFATENDFDNAQGMIGIYAARDGYRRIGEFATHGVGPHEMLLLGDGRTLCIAIGGIETHPDYGRHKLNLDTMQPGIAFVDCRTGSLIEKYDMPAALHRVSTRHMAIANGPDIWIGCQNEGAAGDGAPVLFTLSRDKGLHAVELRQEQSGALQGYVGSIAANEKASTIAVTSPHGNVALVIDAATRRVISRHDGADICGAASRDDGFLFATADAMAGGIGARHGWDNHCMALPG